MSKSLFCVLMTAGLGILWLTVTGQGAVKNPHGDIQWDCQFCHTSESWTKLRQPSGFDHDKTGFSLAGSHSVTDCRNCHRDLTFSSVGAVCVDCHTDVHRNQFGIDCSNCHTPVDWSNRQDILEQHARRGFALLGMHAIADCDACHIGQGREEFVGTPVDCDGCHFGDFTGSQNPNHARAGFSKDCETCHLPFAASWHHAMFEHTPVFALRGAHRQVDCIGCHADDFPGTTTLCYGCHAGDFQATVDPAHANMGFPTDCEACHDETQWHGIVFDHLASSGYAIEGAHAAIGCVDCHVDNRLDVPRECLGCHLNDYNNTADPNHAEGAFPQDCTICHTSLTWSPASFNHDLTSFPLTGAHIAIVCESCHLGGQFAGTPTECIACHQNDYNSVQSPNHVSNNFATDCTLCHFTTGWSPSSFNHAQTQFPLTGAHLGLNCIDCHAGGYSDIPTDCFSCHQNDFNSVQDPNHVTNNFSHDCTQCHTTGGWLPVQFNHNQTQFPLTGAHVGLACIACHAGGYENTPTDCFSCHQNDFNSVQDPNHVTNNFSHDCTICHTTSGWSPAQFDHSQTQFPLTGAHVSLACIACHADGYDNTPTDCFSCHQNDFNSVQDPNHVTNNFSHDCTICHTTSGWSPAQFDHSQTQFPLTGVHITLACIACHSNGYENTPTDCYACHVGDYNGTTDPDHQTMGFPTDCALCHGTFNWGSIWNHDSQYFPIFSGRHDQTWSNCADCHVIPDNYEAFECIFCHEHNQADMDADHDEVPGYSYNSQACYSCHPDGERP